MAIIALIAASAVVFGIAVPANAAGLPDEDIGWQPVQYQDGQIYSQSTEGEARDSHGNIVHAWRSHTDNSLWISVNRSNARQVPALLDDTFAQTRAAPSVVWTDNGSGGNFRIFHTGLDGNIYQTRVQLRSDGYLPTVIPRVTQVPNTARTSIYTGPSAAALPNNSFILAWAGENGPEVWTMFFNGGNNRFQAPSAVPGARTLDAPAIAAQISSWNQIVIVWRGTPTGQVFISRQTYGSGYWTDPYPLGGSVPRSTDYSPSIALTDNGWGLVTMVNSYDDTISSVAISAGGAASSWYDEISRNTAVHTVLVIASNALLYYVRTQANGAIDYKRAADFTSVGHWKMTQ
ncbi:hypothetical protein ACFYY2_11990 [Streptomyces sp. NPDC001822]|uniref:hypothetical protein n=1 Tax=Streptomyces sp. NPDC001822 TaxID=3364614 RepID=UPI0036963F4D